MASFFPIGGAGQAFTLSRLKILVRSADVIVMEILASAQCTIEAAGRTAARVASRVAQVPSALKTVVRDTVELGTAEVATKAGVAVMRTAREMLGTIVDLLA